MARSPLGARAELKGPVGERNVYALKRHGRIAAVAASESGLLIQIGAILATGNDAVVGAAFAERALDAPAGRTRASRRASRGSAGRARPRRRPYRRRRRGARRGSCGSSPARPGPIVRPQALSSARLAAGEDYDLAELVGGMRDRHQHRRSRRQREPDGDRVGAAVAARPKGGVVTLPTRSRWTPVFRS